LDKSFFRPMIRVASFDDANLAAVESRIEA
jgi:hypothetical protein